MYDPKDSGVYLFYLFITPIVLGPFISSILTPHLNDDTVHGSVAPGFENVLTAFRRNFGEGLEREGAAVAVFHRGRRVAHLWGGFADSQADRKWRADTRTVLFSATKAISALCVAVLVDRGYVSYHDRLTDFWPEYGRHGKENTTIEHVMSHMAGLPYLEENVEMHDIQNFENIFEKLENAVPLWEPGTASGYHVITYGFLVEAIVRKLDEKGRDLATFFREEIAEPHDVSIDIGVDESEVPKVARITLPPLWEYIRDCIKNPKMIAMLSIMYARIDDMVDRVRRNPSWLVVDFDTVAVNDPSVLSIPMGAVTGVAGAESLARLFSKTLNGQLISNTTLALLTQPTLNSWHLEKVTLWPVAKGRGFFYEKSPVTPGAYTFGHPGYGGQFIHVDPSQELVVAYVANGLKTGTGELCGPYMRLLREAYNSIVN